MRGDLPVRSSKDVSELCKERERERERGGEIERERKREEKREGGR